MDARLLQSREQTVLRRGHPRHRGGLPRHRTALTRRDTPGHCSNRRIRGTIDRLVTYDNRLSETATTLGMPIIAPGTTP